MKSSRSGFMQLKLYFDYCKDELGILKFCKWMLTDFGFSSYFLIERGFIRLIMLEICFRFMSSNNRL